MTDDAAFCRYYGCKPAQETGYTCPICSNDVAWWDEPYERNEAGKICHAECVEKEDESW